MHCAMLYRAVPQNEGTDTTQKWDAKAICMNSLYMCKKKRKKGKKSLSR